MRSQKGFTVVELILSFSITTIVIVLLFQLLLSLKDLYNTSGYKTELFIKQSTINEQISKEFTTKTITNISDCGIDCITFEFMDGTSSSLSIDRTNKIFSYGTYKTKLVNDSYYGEPVVEFYRNIANVNNNLDSYILINIPILYPLYEDENFGINIIYQYDSLKEYLVGEEF